MLTRDLDDVIDTVIRSQVRPLVQVSLLALVTMMA